MDAWSCSGSTNWIRQVRINKKLTALGAYHAGKPYLPPGYHIRLDSEFFTLRRDDDSIVVAPFAVGAAPAEVVREAEDDYRASGEAAS
jgi:hypothetical protein